MFIWSLAAEGSFPKTRVLANDGVGVVRTAQTSTEKVENQISAESKLKAVWTWGKVEFGCR